MLIECIGSIAGPDGCLVKFQDAIKKPWPDVPLHPPSAESAAEPLGAVL